MKLSEAARIGIDRFPFQCVDNYFLGNDHCCILGAIYFGTFGKIKQMDLVDELYDTYPELFDTNSWSLDALCNTCKENPTLFNALSCMNDRSWTREMLVGWLEEVGL